MAGKTVSPTDFTGRERARLAKEHAEELSARADEISVATALEAERDRNEVVDLSDGPQSSKPSIPVSEVLPENPYLIDEVEVVGPDLSQEYVVVRVNTDLDQMTLGAGQHWTFKVGKKYKVPAYVARHLEEKGYLWH